MNNNEQVAVPVAEGVVFGCTFDFLVDFMI